VPQTSGTGARSSRAQAASAYTPIATAGGAQCGMLDSAHHVDERGLWARRNPCKEDMA